MMSSGERKFIVAADAAALAVHAAEHVLARMQANGGLIAICLTGGSGPRRLYELLGSPAYQARIPWERVHWFIGDERFVPSDDPLNNMSVARRLFLDRCAPATCIHPIETAVPDPGEAARLYEAELQAFYGAASLDPSRPLFDVVLMGVGPDGHTASLFPGYPALDEHERWAVGVAQAPVDPRVPRVTLTLPALDSCHEMLFQTAGSEKRAIVERIVAGEDLPANRAKASGETIWLVDRAAYPEP